MPALIGPYFDLACHIIRIHGIISLPLDLTGHAMSLDIQHKFEPQDEVDLGLATNKMDLFNL